jgi:N utilization substance protein A
MVRTAEPKPTPMTGAELLKAIEKVHKEKKIPRDDLFARIEAGVRLAAEKYYGVEEGVTVSIDRGSGQVHGRRDDTPIESALLLRWAFLGAKQVPTGVELLKVVEGMHREKQIPPEDIFTGVEAAVFLAVQKHYGEEEMVEVIIDQDTGIIHAFRGPAEDEPDEPELDLDLEEGQEAPPPPPPKPKRVPYLEVIDPEELGRIAAQAAKQAMIQKIREAECASLYDIYHAQKGDLVHGTVQRFEGGAATVTLGKSESLLPKSEQIPGETHHVGERVKAVILDVRKVGHRVKIILSRNHPDFVRRLFEQEIPEIADKTIEIRAIAREAGYRTKIAVSSIDLKVDCVGACVGVRGSRIKNIVDELGGERIDIVRWNDSLQVLIPNALQPAQIEEVFLYPRLGRAIVLVKEDQLSLAIGRRGQNVRLASKLVGWDIEIMTHEEYNEELVKAEDWFRQIPDIQDETVEAFIEEGFLSYDDLTFLEPAQLAELGGVTEDMAEEIIEFAEEAAERVEEEEKIAKAEAAKAKADAAAAAPLRPSATSIAEKLLPAGDGPAPEPERKLTPQTLFKEDLPAEEPAAPEQTLTAAQVLPDLPAEQPPPAEAEGDQPPPAPAQEEETPAPTPTED